MYDLIVVSDNAMNNFLIENSKKLSNSKVISFSNLIKSLYFDYDENAITYLIKRHNLKREIAKELIKNMYFIDDTNSSNMNKLKEYKKELDDNNLLIYEKFNNNFKKIKVYGFDYIGKYEDYILSKLGQYEIINMEKYDIENAYLLDNIEEEVIFVMEKVANLIKKGIPFEKIVLTNIDKSYLNALNKISKFYNIPIDTSKHPIYSINNYQNLKNEIINNEIKDERCKSIVNKLNELNDIDYNLIDDYAKEINLESKFSIRIEPLLDNDFNDDYVFILNMNNKTPLTFKDEDYLYDKIKPFFLPNTELKNEEYKIKTKKAILKIKNKVITLKKEDNGTIYSPSTILENTNIIETKNNISDTSNLINILNLAKYLDDFYKYKVKNINLEKLNSFYKINYKKYDHKYKKIEENIFFDKIKELNLSYTSLNSFYECKFKFYLDYILKLNKFDQTFEAYLGSLYHDALRCYKNIDIDKFYIEYQNNHEITLNNKEKFFLENSKKNLSEVIDYLKKMDNITLYNELEYEKKVSYKIYGKINITFKGFIDKIYKYNNKVVLVDYKTGNTTINLNDIIHGFSMQLPIYSYLIKVSTNLEVKGFFLENIMQSNFIHDKNKSIELQKENSLKLNGYIINDQKEIKEFDKTYNDSKFISGMKTKNDGNFYAYSKVLSEKELNNLNKISEIKINNMIKDIEDRNFDIDPKKLRNDNVSCKYCPYKSICFMKNDDIKELENKDTSYLEGDLNEFYN